MQPNPNMPPGMVPPMQPGMQPPMQPGMPGMYPPMPGMYPPMQPGMMPPNAYAYRNQDFNNYQMQGQYKVDKDSIKKHAEDRSGNLQIYELGGLLNEFSAMTGQPPVNPKDVEYIMYNFDQDHSGSIDYKEFKMILKMLGGHKKFDKEKIKNKKQKKHKMGKEGKEKKHKEGKEKKNKDKKSKQK